MRAIFSGRICCDCSRQLPERTDGRSGERRCIECVEKHLVTVFMTFIHRHDWHVAFLKADARTSLPWKASYRTADPLYTIVRRSYQPAEAERDLENCIRSWGQGSVTLRITAAQHLKLTQPNRRPVPKKL